MEDQVMSYIRKRLWLPPEYTHSVSMALAQAYETATIVPVEVTNVGMGTWQITDAELLNGYFPCPVDLNPEFPVGFKIAWTLDHDGAGDAYSDWILLQDAIARGAAIALPATALDTPIPLTSKYVDTADAYSVTDFLLQWTARGIRNSLGLTRAQIEDGAFLTFVVELDAADQETTAHYIGMMMDYVPQLTTGQGVHTDAPLQADGQA